MVEINYEWFNVYSLMLFKIKMLWGFFFLICEVFFGGFLRVFEVLYIRKL